MKIRDGYGSTLSGAEAVKVKQKKKDAAGAAKGKAGAKASDAVNISGKGQEVAQARTLAIEAPEVRETLVSEITGVIDEGKYDVEGKDVAPKMIREHLEMLKE